MIIPIDQYKYHGHINTHYTVYIDKDRRNLYLPTAQNNKKEPQRK